MSLWCKWLQRSKKPCPPITHSFWIRLWKPDFVLLYESIITWTRLEITQHRSVALSSTEEKKKATLSTKPFLKFLLRNQRTTGFTETKLYYKPREAHSFQIIYPNGVKPIFLILFLWKLKGFYVHLYQDKTLTIIPKKKAFNTVTSVHTPSSLLQCTYYPPALCNQGSYSSLPLLTCIHLFTRCGCDLSIPKHTHMECAAALKLLPQAISMLYHSGAF